MGPVVLLRELLCLGVCIETAMTSAFVEAVAMKCGDTLAPELAVHGFHAKFIMR